MNSIARPLTSGETASRPTEMPLWRLYTLRLSYLILVVGLGMYMWPVVLNHSSELAIDQGVRFALLAGLGATALLGMRYPLQMLPLLLFELIWKSVYLAGFALPLYLAHQVTDKAAQDIQACVMVVIFLPLIPWRYVFTHYVLKRGDRWK